MSRLTTIDSSSFASTRAGVGSTTTTANNITTIISKAAVPPTNEQIVNEYFKRISNKDVDGLLELFAKDDDAVIYEPFSKEYGLHGRSEIEHFLKVVIMANEGLTRRKIEFVEKAEEAITAIVTFERGDSITGRFSFLFALEEEEKEKKEKADQRSITYSRRKKIKELKIRFM